MPNQIIFVDSTVQNYQSLLEGAAPNAEVVILDSQSSGIQQISEILENRVSLEAVHIIAHGSEGSLRLGSDILNSENLNRLQSWGNALTEDGDILLYGCDVASGDAGLNFVQKLSHVTGADIAASNNKTGSVALGGDWDLEITSGSIEAATPLSAEAMDAYEYVLANFDVTVATDDGTGNTVGTLSWAILQANNTAGDDTITLTGNVRLTANPQIAIDSNINIIGNNFTVSGDANNSGTNDAGDVRPFFVRSGVANFSNLTVTGGRAQGGNGGGGAAGMGGGLFIYDGTVTLSNVSFSNNSAIGGNGGSDFSGGDGGGGFGGSGFGGVIGGSGGNGGGGGYGGGFGGSGGYGNGGNSGVGGNGGDGGLFAGGGGGGSDFTGGNGGNGGFGGGGGDGGGGFFGGNGGNGGFGGGGGFSGGGSDGSVVYVSSGGFGGGGGYRSSFGDSGAGGGAGFGGAIFIRTGTLNLNATTFNSNTAIGGSAGGFRAGSGQGKGGAIFAMQSTTNTNGNNQGMPSSLPTVVAAQLYFSGNDAANNANTDPTTSGVAADNENVYGVINLQLPTASITAGTTPSEAEPTAPITGNFVVTLSQAAATDLMIFYTVAGTATAGSDYTPLTGSVTIAAGQTSANIDVTPVLDSVVDPGETVQVTLTTTATAGYNLENAKTATLTIADQVPQTFTEIAGSSNPLNSVDLTSHSKPSFADIDSDGDLDVFIGADDGTIRYYRNDGGTFTEQIGSNNPLDNIFFNSFSTPSFADIDSDGDLDAFIGAVDGTIRYSRNDGGTFNQQTGFNNPLFGVDVGSFSALTFADIDADGDSDAFIGALDGTVRYYRNDGGTFSNQTGTSNPFNGVDVGSWSTPTFADIDADGDLDAVIGEELGTIYYYQNSGGSFTQQTGSNNPLNNADVGTFSAPTFADIDNDEDLDAFIGGSDGRIYYYQNAPIVSIAAGTSPTEAGTTGTFTLTLSDPAPDGFTVAYTVAGTATSGTDYEALSGTVSFAAGETTATINVLPTDDAIVDPEETLQIILTDTASYNVAATPNNTATLTIEDNEIGYTIAANNSNVTEGNTGNTTPITFTITRTGRTDVASSVNFDLAGTATNNADYSNRQVAGANITNTGNTINFAAGATEATITLDVLGDVVDEDNETLQISLSSPTAPAGFEATVPVTTPATTTITDDDVAGFTITPADVTLNTNEAGGTATFTIQLNSQPTSDVTLALSSSNTAEGTVTASVTFNATNWNTPQTVTITGKDELNADGEVAYQIITAGAVSTDANYNGLDAPDIDVINSDNDSAGITITQSDGITSSAEGGATDSYEIALNTVPTGSVEITVTADTQTEISLDGNTFSSTLKFTRNDITAQTITVRAIDDSLVSEGNHNGTISHSITNSSDPKYPTTLGISSVNVSITDNDNPPTLTNISKAGTEDTLISFAATDFTNAFTDVDGNSLTKIKITALPANGNLTLNGVSVAPNQEVAVTDLGSLTFSPNANFNGNVSFGWNGFDGTSYSVNTAQINLTVNPVNDLPVVSTISKTGSAGTAIAFTATDFQTAFGDLDNDALSKIQITSLPSNGSLTLNGVAVTANQEIEAAALANLSFTPNAGFSGVITFGWNGFDGTAYAAAGATVSLAVDVINTAPTVGNISKAGNENADIAFTATDFTSQFTDADGNPLAKVKITSLPDNGTLKLSGVAVTANQEIELAALGNLVFSPNANFDGTTSFTWNAFDGIAYGAAGASVNITVNNVNNLPIVSTVVKQGDEDTNIAFSANDFTGAFGDVDGESLAKIQLTSLPQNGTLTLAGTAVTLNQEIAVAELNNLSFTPTANFNGTVTFNWKGSDGTAYAATGSTVSLNVQPVNDPPMLSAAIIDQIAVQNAGFNFTVAENTFTDVDGDILTYSASLENGGALPNWLSFNPTTRTFSGTPAQNNLGEINVKVSASDGVATASDVFTLTVNATPNTAPAVATPISDQTATAGTLFSYTFAENTFVDADGDALSYTVTLADGNPLPAWLSFNAQTRTISGIPPEGTAGTFDILVTAKDIAGASAGDRFNLAVSIPEPAEPEPTEPEPAPTPTPTDTSCLCDLFPTPNLVVGNIIPNIIEGNFNGGSGEDSFVGGAAGESFYGQSSDDIIVVMEGNDNVYGGEGNDLLFGNAGTDYIDAGIGNDTTFGGQDADGILGGEGNDILLGDIGNDTLKGGAGNDLLFGNRGNDFIEGEDGHDTIFGGKDQDALLGGNGNDIILGDIGNDTILGGAGNDLLFGNVGADFIAAGDGNDTIFGGKDNDILKGGKGDDIVLGDIGNDTLCGGEGNDIVFGNTGNDIMDGCEGDDSLYGGKENDTLIGNIGNDLLKGELGDDSLYGNQGSDTLDGGDGKDSLCGGKENDFLYAGSGDDVLNGDLGNDILNGGIGSDRFVLKSGAGSDTITDFTDGEDLLVLAAGLSFANLTITSGSNGALINAGNELLAALNGVDAGLITGEDFAQL